MNYDVIIVGGGPAGIAAAITLSKAGVPTALIEKNIYPREKTCAGILTQKAILFLEEVLSFSKAKQIRSSNHVTIMYQKNNIVQFITHFPFAFVERQIFDNELLTTCPKNNIHVMDGVALIKLLPDENKIILSNNKTLTYKFLIAADGVFSPIRKQLRLKNIPAAFCIQNKIERCLCPKPLKHLQEIQLNFGDVPLGYSWIVPYHEYITIGTGAFTNKIDYSQLLNQHEALCKHIDLPSNSMRRGAFVPIGGFDTQLKYPYENIVIAGDAMGLANPLTGEGIYHALLSGFYAGKSYLLEPQKSKTTYLSFLQSTLQQLTEQKKLLLGFYDPAFLENIFLQLKYCPEYLAEICDNVVSLETQSYNSLIYELRQLLR